MSETAEEIVQKWKYGSERVHVCPYVPWAFDADFLVKLWERTRDEEMLNIVFPGMDRSLNSFVSYLHNRHIVLGCAQPDFRIAAYGWINEAEGVDGARKASFGFLFFREYWGKPEVVEIAKLALRYWFEELRINVLYGATLTFNKPARLFALRMGFSVVGDLPGFFIHQGEMLDARLVVLTRTDFWAKWGKEL